MKVRTFRALVDKAVAEFFEKHGHDDEIEPEDLGLTVEELNDHIAEAFDGVSEDFEGEEND